MISFIIIGRNEGWKLTKCFESVFKAIEENNLTDSEVIYVDSKSTDDSIARAKKFPEVKIFQITGQCNAAIGRNIGAKEAKGYVIFFIDGDMEIQPDFLPLVYNDKYGLKYEFVSGQLKNFNYSNDGKFINNSWQYRNVLKSDKTSVTTGGIFIISRKLWNCVDGMDHKFKRGEDLDFSLRLTRKGYRILRKKEIIAYHYTIAYNHSDRMWSTLFSGDIFYAKSLLYRKHFLNRFMYKKMLSSDYSMLIMLLALFFSFAFNSVAYILIYVLVLFYRSVKSSEPIITKMQLIIYYMIRDLLTIFGFFFFFPNKNIDINYKEV
jgi:glycosyltransferase involved in cell wall biosynthesis